MDPSIYETYYKMERSHWWFHARREIIFALLEKFCPSLESLSVVDIGTGTGSLLEEFEKRGIRATGHDSSELAVEMAASSSRLKVELKKMPDDYQTARAEFDVVLLLDVLEHIEDDRKALEAALQVLKPGGILFCTVPAYPGMWSTYDDFCHHFRRYEKKDLENLMRAEGLNQVKVMKVSHFCTLLFPFIWLGRFFERTFLSRKTYRPFFVPSFLNTILYFIFRFEKKILLKHNLPFGSSLMMILRK